MYWLLGSVRTRRPWFSEGDKRVVSNLDGFAGDSEIWPGRVLAMVQGDDALGKGLTRILCLFICS